MRSQAGPQPWPPPPRRVEDRDRSRSPGNRGRFSLFEGEGQAQDETSKLFEEGERAPESNYYCTIIPTNDGQATPEEALEQAERHPTQVFWLSDAAKRSRMKTARRVEITPHNRRMFNKNNAGLVYSHDDKCFYVAEIPGAAEAIRIQRQAAEKETAEPQNGISVFVVQEGNISFKQLSEEHQKEFLKARGVTPLNPKFAVSL